MKRYLVIVAFVFVFTSTYSQDLKGVVFVDGCSGQVVKPKYDICTEDIFLFRVSYNMDGKDATSYGSSIIDIRKPYKDTLLLSKFIFSIDNTSKKGKFMYCDTLCEGVIADYFENGNKRIEGVFSNGNPKEIKSFRYDGTLRNHKYFINETLKASRIDFFDKNGELETYEIYKRKRKKTVIRTYNRANEILSRKVHKGNDLINFNITNPNDSQFILTSHGFIKT